MHRLMGIPLRGAGLVCAVTLLAVPIAPPIAWAGDDATSSATEMDSPGASLPGHGGTSPSYSPTRRALAIFFAT